MKLVRWKRFTWNLASLPTPAPALAGRYAIRAAFPDDRESVINLVVAAFTLDSAWADTMAPVKEWLTAHMTAAFENEVAPAVVITHGQRIIAASAISTESEAETNLLSGPCVSMEYRNRGLGTALLYHTLLQLRQCGLEQASGVTKANVPVAKFVYPKFGAVGVDHEFEPALIRT
jgi:predicted N-acetyltransferase YhbS